jgi:hypothetical protein
MGAFARVLSSSGLSSRAGGYELIEVPSDQVDTEMLVAGGASGFPGVLQGLWWMDGNPLPDELMSLGGSTWNAETRTTRIRVYGERVWSWHGNLLGRGLYALARLSRLDYELRLDDDLSSGVITPIVSVLGKQVRVPGRVARLTLRFVRDGHWIRESCFFGLFYHVYDLRRVVRGDRARLPAFAEYLRSAPPRSYLAVRRGAVRIIHRPDVDRAG